MAGIKLSSSVARFLLASLGFDISPQQSMSFAGGGAKGAALRRILQLEPRRAQGPAAPPAAGSPGGPPGAYRPTHDRYGYHPVHHNRDGRWKTMGSREMNRRYGPGGGVGGNGSAPSPMAPVVHASTPPSYSHHAPHVPPRHDEDHQLLLPS
jgi:hypothetical protein